MIRIVHGVDVNGIDVDGQTRCAHWHSKLDIIALRFKCCGRWYPCFECHTAIADHSANVWPANERDERSIMCGACGEQLSISEYFDSESACPRCGAAFNPGCAKHHHLYFEI